MDGPRRPRPVEVLTWSAASPAAETQLRERLADHFQTLPEEDFADAAYTLRVGRTVQRVRGALVATGSADAGRRLGDAKHVRTGDDVAREIVFTFPGQGAQQPGMFRDLYEDEPLFRSGCDAAFEVLRPLLDRDLRTLWLSPEPDLTDTEVAQPLLYVLESTLAHCLMHWGVQPDVLIGHSLGELVAGAVAGVLDFEDGLRAVARRARAIGRAPRGRMLAVGASAEAVQDELTERVVVAAVNSPREVVLSGPVGGVADDRREVGWSGPARPRAVDIARLPLARDGRRRAGLGSRAARPATAAARYPHRLRGDRGHAEVRRRDLAPILGGTDRPTGPVRRGGG